MGRFRTIFLILLAFWSTAVADEQVYSGWVYFADELDSPQILVIETEAQLREFQKRLPEHRPTKKKPAPPNQDPLRRQDAVDFERHTLVVVMRSQTISAYPKFVATTERKGKLVLRFRLPQPPPEARPFGWGVYRAVVVPKTESTIAVRFD